MGVFWSAHGRIIAFRDIDPVWRAELLAVVDAADLFADDEPRIALTQSGARTWHVRLQIVLRRLVLAEPLLDPELEAVLRAVRNCFPTRRAMAIEEVPPWLIERVAAAEAPPESVALNYLTHDDIMESLPTERRERIKARASDLYDHQAAHCGDDRID